MTYRTYNLPDQLRLFAMRWIIQNKDFQFLLFNDFDILDYVNRILTDNKNLEYLKEYFESLPLMCMKANFFKFLILYEKGGIYLDTDIEPFVPIEQWPEYPFSQKFIIIQEHSNSSDHMHFLMSSPNHPLYLNILDSFYQQWKENDKLFILPLDTRQDSQNDLVKWFAGEYPFMRGVLTFFGLEFKQKIDQKENQFPELFKLLKNNDTDIQEIANTFKIDLRSKDALFNNQDSLFKHYQASEGNFIEFGNYVSWKTQVQVYFKESKNQIQVISLQIPTVSESEENEKKTSVSILDYFVKKEIEFVNQIEDQIIQKDQQIKNIEDQIMKELETKKIAQQEIKNEDALQMQQIESLKLKQEAALKQFQEEDAKTKKQIDEQNEELNGCNLQWNQLKTLSKNAEENLINKNKMLKQKKKQIEESNNLIFKNGHQQISKTLLHKNMELTNQLLLKQIEYNETEIVINELKQFYQANQIVTKEIQDLQEQIKNPVDECYIKKNQQEDLIKELEQQTIFLNKIMLACTVLLIIVSAVYYYQRKKYQSISNSFIQKINQKQQDSEQFKLQQEQQQLSSDDD